MVRRLARLLLDPIALLAGVIGIGAAVMLLVSYHASEQQDADAIQHTRSMLAMRLDKDRHGLARLLKDYAVWDEMDDKVNQRGTIDQDWLSETLTAAISEEYNVTFAAILESNGRTFFYFLENGMPQTQPYNLLLENPQVQQIIKRARQQSPYHGENVRIILDRGRFWYVGAALIVPKQTSATASAGRMILMARPLNASYLEEITDDYALSETRATQERWTGADGALPIRSFDSRPIGVLSWKQKLPGDHWARLVLRPVLIYCAALLLACAIALWFSQRRRGANPTTQLRLLKQGEALRSLVANAGTEGLQLDDRLNRLCEAIASTLNCGAVRVWRHEPKHRRLVCIQAFAFPGSYNRLQEVFDLEQHPGYNAAMERQRVILIDTSTVRQPVCASLALEMRQREVNSLLDAPVASRGAVWGILSIEDRRNRRWHADEVNFVSSAADIVALLHETDARVRAEGQLYRQFYFDPESGLPNVLQLQVSWQTKTAEQRIQRYVCCLIDIRELSDIGRQYGIENAGQAVNQWVERLHQTLATGETLARLERQRFILLLHMSDPASISVRLEQLMNNLTQPIQIGVHLLSAHAYAGLSIQNAPETPLTQLLRQAETALLQAKKQQRPRWALFDSQLEQEEHARLQLQQDLLSALEKKEFFVYYQPIVDAKTHTLIGAEALLRWEHPTLGLLSPDQFIPLAEEAELMTSIGIWFSDQVGAQFSAWRSRFNQLKTIAINLSPSQLLDPALPNRLESMLNRYQLSPAMLELELTESIMIEPSATLANNLHRFAELGIALVIDDFGAGYASFNYLLRFSVQKLKIDRHFTEGVPNSANHSSLVEMIISMGHSLGLLVTGEGVETAAQAEFLTERGCDFLQGYFINQPLTAEAFEYRLGERIKT